jgi:sulfate permease, SulP family
MDLSLVAGVDLSSAEVFVRVQRLLARRGVIFVLCGFALDSEVGRALENVDLFREDGVEVFSYLNEALECTLFP